MSWVLAEVKNEMNYSRTCKVTQLLCETITVIVKGDYLLEPTITVYVAITDNNNFKELQTRIEALEIMALPSVAA